MTQHAGPPSHDDRPPIPEPSYAERARTLLHLTRSGTLATMSRRHPGHPFASIMPFALDETGRPLFLISSMAMHTQNLAGDARASLLAAQPDVGVRSRSAPGARGERDTGAGDPLAQPRVTVMGEARKLAGADRDEARALYLTRHENAKYWVDFDDFSFWRLEVMDVYFVGGFAAMDWVTASEYREARPDPLAEVAPGIIEHMNRDHADALLTYARVLADEPADEAVMVSVDRLGFRLRLQAGDRRHAVRIAFPREVGTPNDARQVLIDMLRDARSRASA